MTASIRTISTALLVAALISPHVMSQESKAKAPAKSPAKAEAQEPAAPAKAEAADVQSATPTPEFQAQMAEWKKLLEKMRELQVRYKATKPSDRAAIEKEYNELVDKGQKMAPELVKAALASYQAAPNQNDEVSKFLFSQAYSDVKLDHYQQAYDIAKALADNDFPNAAVNSIAGVSAFALNNYNDAEKYLKIAQEKKVLDEEDSVYLNELSNYRELWEQEQKLRAEEAKKDDLPRVLFKTDKGDIEIELFENEAPNSVANFISLVEKKFYNGLTFHRVIHGFMAQGGDPKGDGSGGPGYTIACECYEPNHRSHFAGTLSMAHAGKDTGGSQFFLTFRPTPHLNGKHTVFGRVIKGMDVLQSIKQTSRGVEPDKIIEATVIRKRPHDYKPKTKPDK